MVDCGRVEVAVVVWGLVDEMVVVDTVVASLDDDKSVIIVGSVMIASAVSPVWDGGE